MRNFVITVNGKSYEVGVEEVGATASVSAPKAAATLAAPVNQPAAAPQAAPAPAPKANLGSGEKVLSPFPGLIKGLLVAEGTKVEKDQPILVLEAMKMDNDMNAPCDGVISFKAAVGSNVDTGDVMAVIG